ncbi:hypothetical protein NXT3_PC00120 (plasmid) [Sinorhizobium fredii]|uniref:Uncharacterized protein n=2 Tax=Rhizobium fredii TaxID=380 RepID=A0A2L0HEU3_RHIFR|nr:hypothetical protein NXT3_PC00120 [Sinorhizobium fredii]
MRERRNFVVEFKSNRRQAKPRNTSIWGDADLKAIAREVEVDLPHAGGGAETKSVTQEPPLVAVEPAAEITERADKPNEQSPAAASSDPAASESPMPMTDAAQLPAEADDVAVAVSAVDEADRSTPMRRSTASKRTKPARTSWPNSRPAEEAPQTGPDELEALEAENRRLKALWRTSLQAENAQLREMLARFAPA